MQSGCDAREHAGCDWVSSCACSRCKMLSGPHHTTLIKHEPSRFWALTVASAGCSADSVEQGSTYSCNSEVVPQMHDGSSAICHNMHNCVPTASSARLTTQSKREQQQRTHCNCMCVPIVSPDSWCPGRTSSRPMPLASSVLQWALL